MAASPTSSPKANPLVANATALAPAKFRSAQQTFAPLAASARATAAPMPLAAPVTSATVPGPIRRGAPAKLCDPCFEPEPQQQKTDRHKLSTNAPAHQLVRARFRLIGAEQHIGDAREQDHEDNTHRDPDRYIDSVLHKVHIVPQPVENQFANPPPCCDTAPNGSPTSRFRDFVLDPSFRGVHETGERSGITTE
jgi:hypothetical protein